MTKTSSDFYSIEVFFAYSREDEELLKKLIKHLRPLQRDGVISTWYDRDISAGSEWEGKIESHLNSAKIILLLISADFMNSDYCYGVEMDKAMKRHEAKEVVVIPVILRPVYWQIAKLNKLQALPKNAKPVTSWINQDEAFLDVAQSIRKIAKKLNNSVPIKPIPPLPPVNFTRRRLLKGVGLAGAGLGASLFGKFVLESFQKASNSNNLADLSTSILKDNSLNCSENSHNITDYNICKRAFFSQSCSYIEEDWERQGTVYIKDSNGQTKRYQMPSRSIRGWSYKEGSLASYIFFDGQESKVRIQKFHPDRGFGDILYERHMSPRDSFRGWDWDGNTASYLEVDGNGRTKLFIQPFDINFGFSIDKYIKVLSNSAFDKSNSSWTWSGKLAQYTYLSGDSIHWKTEQFNGDSFGNNLMEVIREGRRNIVGRSCY